MTVADVSKYSYDEILNGSYVFLTSIYSVNHTVPDPEAFHVIKVDFEMSGEFTPTTQTKPAQQIILRINGSEYFKFHERFSEANAGTWRKQSCLLYVPAGKDHLLIDFLARDYSSGAKTKIRNVRTMVISMADMHNFAMEYVYDNTSGINCASCEVIRPETPYELTINVPSEDWVFGATCAAGHFSPDLECAKMELHTPDGQIVHKKFALS